MKVLVGMSGGVDSAVTALLLKRAGFEVCGATLHLWAGEPDRDHDSTCCSLADVEDARATARKLHIDHLVFNFQDVFEREVIGRFVDGYARGETPNPCTDCNRGVKFPALYRRARELGFDAIATGHYARVVRDEATGRCLLRKALDEDKDQSYVLYGLSQEILAHCMLPLGSFTKPQVRELAREAGFVVADKPDSQDICFVPDGDHLAFLRRRGVEQTSGDIVDRDGVVIGHHRGLAAYTIGQRKGVEIAATTPDSRPYYVIAKDTEGNRLWVGHDEDARMRIFQVGDLNWVSIPRPQRDADIEVKTRYRQHPARARVHLQDSGTGDEHRDVAIVTLEEPLPGIASGQACVFYDGDIVLGGGTIICAAAAR